MVDDAVDVSLAVEGLPVALLLVDLFGEAFKHLMGGLVFVAQFLAQFGKCAANAVGLIDADLFGHGQVHGQVQKGVAVPGFDGVVPLKDFFDVSVKRRVILWMFAHPL